MSKTVSRVFEIRGGGSIGAPYLINYVVENCVKVQSEPTAEGKKNRRGRGTSEGGRGRGEAKYGPYTYA